MSIVRETTKLPVVNFIFRRVSDLKTWEFMIAQSLFMFLMGFLFSAVSKAVPHVFGEGEVGNVARDAVSLTKAATFTGNYKDAPKEFQIV